MLWYFPRYLVSIISQTPDELRQLHPSAIVLNLTDTIHLSVDRLLSLSLAKFSCTWIRRALSPMDVISPMRKTLCMEKSTSSSASPRHPSLATDAKGVLDRTGLMFMTKIILTIQISVGAGSMNIRETSLFLLVERKLLNEISPPLFSTEFVDIFQLLIIVRE